MSVKASAVAAGEPLATPRPAAVPSGFRGLGIVDALAVFICVAMIVADPIYGIVIVPLAIVAIGMERLHPLRPQSTTRPGWRADVYHAIITRDLGTIVAVAIALPVTAFLVSALPGPIGVLRTQPLVLRLVEGYVIADCVAYWQHRLGHTVTWLWRFHRVHHVGNDVDWLTRYRAHPVDFALMLLVQYLPLFVLSLPALGVALYVDVVYWVGTWAHANVRHRIGRLSWVINNPELHHWHHSSDAPRRGWNHAQLLPLWDVIFGTAHRPVGERPRAYGVPDEHPHDYLEHLLGVFENPTR